MSREAGNRVAVINLSLAAILFAAISFLIALSFWYLQIASNGSMLSDSPDALAYLQFSYFSIPLLIASACAFFTPSDKLPWIYLGLAAAGLLAAFVAGKSILLVLIFPYSLLATWGLGVKAVRSATSFVAIPTFASMAVLALGVVAGYGDFVDRQAPERAHSFCNTTVVGEPLAATLQRANFEQEHPGHARWVQVFESVNAGDGTVTMSYRNINLRRSHQCVVSIRGAVAVGKLYLKK